MFLNTLPLVKFLSKAITSSQRLLYYKLYSNYRVNAKIPLCYEQKGIILYEANRCKQSLTFASTHR